MMTQRRWSYARQRHVKTGGEEGGCKGGGGGGEGRIVVVVVVINGNVDSNGSRRRPRTAMRFLLPGEDGGGDGS
jgi:hypothetical protein